MHRRQKTSETKFESDDRIKLSEIVVSAFKDVRDGFSPDRVVVDPFLNSLFLEKCNKLRPGISAKNANKHLLNARKAGLLKGLKTTKRTGFKDEDDYRYASEIAVRFIEKRDAVTLDDIICDPERASDFDKITSRICPDHSPLQYRWAALNLRKSSKLKPEIMSHVLPPVGVKLGPVSEIVLSTLSSKQGLYIFYGGQQTLYVGEAGNLRLRIEKHLDHSDNKGLARWFWENSFSDVNLELQQLPENTTKKMRRALEAELIISRHPLFNVLRP